MKRTIPEHLKSGLPSNATAKEYLAAIEEKYYVSDKNETGILMSKLTNMKYDNIGNVRDYIQHMIHIQNQLGALKLNISDDFIIHLALNSLPSEFSQLKTSYNTQNQKWTLNDLLSKSASEEEKLRNKKTTSALFVSHSKPNHKRNSTKGRSNYYAPKKTQGFKRHGKDQTKDNKGSEVVNKAEMKCFFCKKIGHRRKYCFKFTAWLEKRRKE